MKKIRFIIFLTLITTSTFGQQFLWTSAQKEIDNEKYIPLNRVTDEVLKFYEQYDRYYDLSGFSKERFLKEIDFGFDGWDFLKEINDLTVFAAKSNTGQGSVVLVMSISHENINMIIFSNSILDGFYNYEHTYGGRIEREKQKFASWFETLLN